MSGRTDIHLKLVCADCGEALEVDESNKSTRMSYHSAYNAECGMSIKPCRQCIAKITEPAQKLANAVKELTK